MLPIDYQSYSPSKDGFGTIDARIENTQRSVIEPLQNAGNADHAKQDNNNTHRKNEHFQHSSSKDSVSLSKQGKQAAKEDTDSQLNEEDQKQVKELKNRDREVRVHEQAHAAVGGQYASSPSYEYQTGPDGKRYAVGGEVSIDVSEASKPEDTIQKMQIVRAAALAPAEPSSQDLKVAAEASQKENQARSQVSQEQLDGNKGVENVKVPKMTQQNNHFQLHKHIQAYNDVSSHQANNKISIRA